MLSHCCKYVFLFNHEYVTKTKPIELPYNVIRVSSWREVFDRIKNLNEFSNKRIQITKTLIKIITEKGGRYRNCIKSY